MVIFGKYGTVKVKATCSETKYFWGDISEIEGKTIILIEVNENGDCLSYLEDKGIVDVASCDVEEKNEVIQKDYESVIEMLVDEAITENSEKNRKDKIPNMAHEMERFILQALTI